MCIFCHINKTVLTCDFVLIVVDARLNMYLFIYFRRESTSDPYYLSMLTTDHEDPCETNIDVGRI